MSEYSNGKMPAIGWGNINIDLGSIKNELAGIFRDTLKEEKKSISKKKIEENLVYIDKEGLKSNIIKELRGGRVIVDTEKLKNFRRK